MGFPGPTGLWEASLLTLVQRLRLLQLPSVIPAAFLLLHSLGVQQEEGCWLCDFGESLHLLGPECFHLYCESFPGGHRGVPLGVPKGLG